MNLDQLFDIKGRTAVITGAGGALAGTLAGALGGLGVKIAVLDLNLPAAESQAQAIRSQGGEAHAFTCNVLVPEDLERAREKVEKLWGPPDYLINGAGGNSPKATTAQEFLEPADLDRNDSLGFFTMSLEDFQTAFGLNFTGTLLPCRVFAPAMVQPGQRLDPEHRLHGSDHTPHQGCRLLGGQGGRG